MSLKRRSSVPGFVVILIAQVFLVLSGPSARSIQPAVIRDGWLNVTGNLAYRSSECGNLSALSAVPDSDTIIAGIALRGLWANRSGNEWLRLGMGAGSDTIENRPTWIVHDPANPEIFWEAGIYNGGGVYKTTDAGNTFKRL